MGALAANSYVAEIAKLRAENELLRAENWNLKDQLRNFTSEAGDEFMWSLQNALRLTPTAARMLAVIMRAPKGCITKDKIWSIAFDDRDGDIKIIDVYLVKIRRALTPIGARIETVWGRGLTLPPESKAIIENILAARRSV